MPSVLPNITEFPKTPLSSKNQANPSPSPSLDEREMFQSPPPSPPADKDDSSSSEDDGAAYVGCQTTATALSRDLAGLSTSTLSQGAPRVQSPHPSRRPSSKKKLEFSPIKPVKDADETRSTKRKAAIEDDDDFVSDCDDSSDVDEIRSTKRQKKAAKEEEDEAAAMVALQAALDGLPKISAETCGTLPHPYHDAVDELTRTLYTQYFSTKAHKADLKVVLNAIKAKLQPKIEKHVTESALLDNARCNPRRSRPTTAKLLEGYHYKSLYTSISKLLKDEITTVSFEDSMSFFDFSLRVITRISEILESTWVRHDNFLLTPRIIELFALCEDHVGFFKDERKVVRDLNKILPRLNMNNRTHHRTISIQEINNTSINRLGAVKVNHASHYFISTKEEFMSAAVNNTKIMDSVKWCDPTNFLLKTLHRENLSTIVDTLISKSKWHHEI